MIARLTGRIASVGIGDCVLEVGGIGFRLAMSMTSLSALPAVGDEVTVHTHLHVREDELSLFGFESESEKAAFEQLITVSGVGPKVALATLSVLSASDLAAAVGASDATLISSVPGIGLKTAQRIILDLSGKLDALDVPGARGSSGAGLATAEATDALLVMGFSSAEASTALGGFDGEPSDTQALVTYALRRLGGAR